MKCCVHRVLCVECRGFETHLKKSDCLGCAVLLYLVVCLTLLASSFLIKTCIIRVLSSVSSISLLCWRSEVKECTFPRNIYTPNVSYMYIPDYFLTSYAPSLPPSSTSEPFILDHTTFFT